MAASGQTSNSSDGNRGVSLKRAAAKVSPQNQDVSIAGIVLIYALANQAPTDVLL